MTLKVIHRIYFGFDGKPDVYGEYLNNWAKQVPDFEIKQWNASNLPLDVCDYVKNLAEEKDGVFLSDYFRWWLLNKYGGIYLDADIEIVDGVKLNKLVLDLENSNSYSSFIGIENRYGYTAHSMGSKPGADLPVFMCELYERLGKLYHLRRTRLIAPQLVQLFFYDKGLAASPEGSFSEICKTPTIIGGVNILPQSFFSPLGYGSPPFLECDVRDTVLCHHFGGSWLTDSKTNLKKMKFLNDYLVENKKSKSTLNTCVNGLLMKIEQFVRHLRVHGARSTFYRIVSKLH